MSLSAQEYNFLAETVRAVVSFTTTDTDRATIAKAQKNVVARCIRMCEAGELKEAFEILDYLIHPSFTGMQANIIGMAGDVPHLIRRACREFKPLLSDEQYKKDLYE